MEFRSTHPLIKELMDVLKKDGQGRWTLGRSSPSTLEAIFEKYSGKPDFNRALLQILMFGTYLASKDKAADVACAIIDASEAARRKQTPAGLSSPSIDRAKKIKDTFVQIAARRASTPEAKAAIVDRAHAPVDNAAITADARRASSSSGSPIPVTAVRKGGSVRRRVSVGRREQS